jgi:hypothetical protein
MLMGFAVLCVTVGLFTVHVETADVVRVLYTAGFADMMVSPKKSPAKKMTPPVRQDRTGHYVLSEATFNATTGKLLSLENVTEAVEFAMGYVASSSTGSAVTFSAQHKLSTGGLDNVEVYGADRTSGRVSPAVTDPSALLAPCQSPGPHNCTDASTFYSQIGPHGELLLSYRAWSGFGDAVGNQALALQDPQGKIQVLTYNVSDLQTMHVCPRFVPGSNASRVLLVVDRNGAALLPACLPADPLHWVGGGDEQWLALHDIPAGTTTMLMHLPQALALALLALTLLALALTLLALALTLLAPPETAAFSGCPDFLPNLTAAGEATFFYIAQATLEPHPPAIANPPYPPHGSPATLQEKSPP